MKKPIWLLAISALMHGMAGYHYWVTKDFFIASGEWTEQFYFLLTVSFIISVNIFLVPPFSVRFLPILIKIILQFFILVIIGLPFSEDLNIEFLILLIILLETTLYIHSPFNIFLSVIFIGIIFYMNNRSINAWTYSIPSADIFSVITMSIISFILAILSCALQFFIKKHYESEINRRQLEESIATLTTANMDLQHYAIKAEENSMIQERKRISREIHDTVGYTLTNIIMMMQAAMDLSFEDEERIRSILSQARTQAQVGLNETRRALRELRAMEERPLNALKALYILTQTFQRATGVEVVLESGNIPWSFGEEIDQVIYRLIQEGLTNAFRHGKASKVTINLWMDSEGLSVIIQDNGQGCENITEGIGLSGMKERITALNGRMEIKNISQGFKVTAFLPVRRYEVLGENYQDNNNLTL